MKITTTARHYELTPALKDYAERKVLNLKKYFDQIGTAQITYSLEKYRHAVEISVHVNGRDFNSKEESEDMYASIDKVVDKLERQILKYKGKIKRRKSNKKISEMEYSFPEEGDGSADEREELHLDIIPADRTAFPGLTLAEALQSMEDAGREFNIFMNSETEKINVIYVQKDGTIGLLEV